MDMNLPSFYFKGLATFTQQAQATSSQRAEPWKAGWKVPIFNLFEPYWTLHAGHPGISAMTVQITPWRESRAREYDSYIEQAASKHSN